MVQTPTKALTLDEFLQQPETKPIREYIDGAIQAKPMPQGQHSSIQGELVTTINLTLKKEQIAWALPELRCTFRGRSLVPDIAVFTWDHLPTNEDGTLANRFDIAPDWAIEILSPGQSLTIITKKILYYLQGGCQLGWIVDPSEKVVFTYSQNKTPQFFEEDSDQLLPVPQFAKDVNITLGQLLGWLQVKIL
jgi:Uma2 family endonuclease